MKGQWWESQWLKRSRLAGCTTCKNSSNNSLTWKVSPCVWSLASSTWLCLPTTLQDTDSPEPLHLLLEAPLLPPPALISFDHVSFSFSLEAGGDWVLLLPCVPQGIMPKIFLSTICGGGFCWGTPDFWPHGLRSYKLQSFSLVAVSFCFFSFCSLSFLLFCAHFSTSSCFLLRSSASIGLLK